MWTQIRLLLEEQSDQGPPCLPVCKYRFEKFARIFSRRHKQTTFSVADFHYYFDQTVDKIYPKNFRYKSLRFCVISSFSGGDVPRATSLGGSVGCAVRLETRRSRVQPPPRSATFFRGDWSRNIFCGHSLPSADSRRTVVSFWRKNVHNTG